MAEPSPAKIPRLEMAEPSPAKIPRLEMAEPSPAKIPRLTLDGEDGNIDRLSPLPECVLLHILSFLDLKEAAATTVLAKSWKDLFLQLPDIDLTFFVKDDNYCNHIRRFHLFAMFSNRMLLERNNDALISSLKIDAKHFIGHFRRDFNSMLSNTAEALSTYKVKKLHLNLDAGNSRTESSCIYIPAEIFSSETLTSLSLTFAAGWAIPKSVCLPNVMHVHFNPFRFEDENSIQRLLDGCPKLENFEFTIKVSEYDDGEVRTLRMSSSSLKLLMVAWDVTDAPEMNIDLKSDSLQRLTLSLKGGHTLKVETPNLEFLSLSAEVLELNMIQGFPASIHEAVIDAEYLSQWTDMRDLYSRCQKATKFFDSMHNLRLLTLSETIMKALYVASKEIPPFENLYKLRFIPLYCHDFPRNWMIQVFIKLFAICPNLEILIFDQVFKNYFCEDVPLGTIFPPSFVQHIKQIEICSFKGRAFEYKLVEHFMNNGTSLEIVCLKKVQKENAKKPTYWKRKQRKKVLSFKTCSAECEVLFI
ncbi:hypothetical protein VNO80_07035 [Phaseolus coccineus]|uniref:F-box domain-containing protein n=1 Tax=Phaseolus coccineus TaxID=3886 RepID=A0AAN9NHY9_PHACN